MTVRGLLCIPLGHKWTEASDVQETYPVFRCRRCGRTQGFAAETQGTEGWLERGGRAARTDRLMDGRIQRRP